MVGNEIVKQYRQTQMTKETQATLLQLLKFLNKHLLTSDVKMFYYGPTIHGLTTDNIVQFSIDIGPRNPEMCFS